MRLNLTQLEDITGLTQPAAQVRWFHKHYGVRLAHDVRGPIITKEAFEALVAKQCGIKDEKPRPQLNLSR